MFRTDKFSVITAKNQLKDMQDDIKYSIEEEDSMINVSNSDLKKIEFVKQTIESLERDYERLNDKIILAMHHRTNEIGKEQAKSDFIIQSLNDILKSEKC